MNRRQLFKWITVAGASVTAAAVSTGLYWKQLKSEQRINLLIAGAAPMVPYVRMLAQAFNREHSHVDIVIEKGHSRAGLIALEHAGIDIAMMSQDLAPNENYLNIHNALIGIDGIAIVVHPDSPITGLSTIQAREVFEGIITNWKELGGSDARIHLYGRNESSTTRASIENILMDGGLISRQMKELGSARDVAREVSNDVHGIGFLSVRNLTDALKALEIDGALVEEKDLYLKKYPLTRDMFLAYGTDISPIASKFIEFTLSEHGQKILADAGLLRVR